VPVVSATDENVARAAEILRQGGIVAFPTETVYGLGADALSTTACARIFAAKRRPEFDPLIVHVEGIDALDGLVARLDDRTRRVAAAFWPGPLTLVLPKTPRVPDLVTAGRPTVAIRVPAHPVARALLAAGGRPIAAPSANPFGYLSPTTAAHVAAQLGDAVEWILDGGASTVGLESTIVDLSGDRPVLLRPGAVEVERLEPILGALDAPATNDPARAPGMSESHYAPHARLRLLDGPATSDGVPSRVGLLAFRTPERAVSEAFTAMEALAPSGDVIEAAANLFACLHRLDEANLDAIWVEPVPLHGLGVAIADRLRRAAARR
jgi:L-threonylcarbamoyladenylate synthase